MDAFPAGSDRQLIGSALVAARLLLTAAFGMAGVAKLFDPQGSRSALTQFGVSERLVRPLANTLPLVELAVAAALVPTSTATAAAAAAAALVVVFSAVIVRTLARGEVVDCHCFGKLDSSVIGRRTLARNGVLVALAVVVASRPIATPTWTELGVIGGVALVVGEAWVILALLRRYGVSLRRIEELEDALQPASLELGADAPPFVLPDLAGREVILEDILAGSSGALLVFVSPGCGACDLVLRGLEGSVTVISTGPPDVVAARAAALELSAVLVDEVGEVAELYGVAAVPTAVLVDDGGRLARPPAVGAADVMELIGLAVSVRATAEAR